MRTRLHFLVPIALALLALSGCAPSGHGYPETVSGLTYRNDSLTLNWLDNDRLIVPGQAPQEGPFSAEGDPKSGIYIWDVRSNTHTRYAGYGAKDGFSFCYYQGFVTYIVFKPERKLSDSLPRIEGRFGEEKELPEGAKSNASWREYDLSPCPNVDRNARLRPEHLALEQQKLGVLATFLREEDGYIFGGQCPNQFCEKSYNEAEEEARRALHDQRVTYYRPGRPEPIELPILAKELDRGSYVRYAEWANKYLIVPATRRDTEFNYSYGLSGKMPFQIYLMTPEGEVEAIPLQESHWLPPGNAQQSRAGIVLAVGISGSGQEEGIWLMPPGGQRIRLTYLPVRTTGVSPDGCKLAYAERSYDRKKTDYLRVIDLCAKH